MKSEIYQKHIVVAEEHIDDQRHVNNVVFLQWVQDIAVDHWFSKSADEFNQAYYWVVLDHFIEYKGPAFLGDDLVVKTYVKRNAGMRSIRVVEFYKDDKLIVRAKTNWCLLDRERNRPTRIPEQVDEMFFSK